MDVLTVALHLKAFLILEGLKMRFKALCPSPFLSVVSHIFKRQEHILSD